MLSKELQARLNSYKYYKNYVYYKEQNRCRLALYKVGEGDVSERFSINHYKNICEGKAVPIEKQKLHARVTRALSFLYGSTLKSRCIATVICGLLPKLAVSHDNANSHVSYSRNGESYKNHKRRVSIKFSRLLSRYYPDKFTDRELERLQTAYEYECQYTKKVLEGEEALAIYNNCTSEDFTSCMTGSKSYLLEDHFLHNTEKLKLVVLYMDNRAVARTKLWTNDDGTLYLDRVYVRRGIPNLTVDHATAVISKDYTLVDYYNFTLYSPPGKMPYMDYPEKFDRIGDNVKFYSDGKFNASSAEGIDESCCCECSNCERIFEDATEYICEDSRENLCEDCAESFTGSHTEIDGTWYNNDDIIYDDIDNESILSENAVQVYSTDNYTKQSNCTELDESYYNRYSYALDSDTIETHDGSTILESDSVEHLGKIYHEDEELPEEPSEECEVLSVQ